MSQNVVAFITKLITHFPLRHESQEREQEWLASMVRNLRGYTAGTLEKAAQQIVDSRTDRRFPLPAECKKACDEIERIERMKEPAQFRTEPPKFSDWRIKLADELIQGPMGRRADKEGWLGALHVFARNEGRLPTEREIPEVKAAAKSFDETYAKAIRDLAELQPKSEKRCASWVKLGDAHSDLAALVRLGDSILKRRAELSERVK